MAYKAIIAGASGLIGSYLLNLLLQHADYDEVVILVRKELPVQHKKLLQVVVDYDDLSAHKQLITGHVVFCCLGTTKAKTPDESEYRKIDHDYPLLLAQLAANNGVKHYHLVSAIGADSKSGNFYLKTKGEAEEGIFKTNIASRHIYQPSLLTGDRKEPRLAEKIFTVLMKVFNPLLIGGLKKYRSILALTVAQAMVNQSLNNEEGVFIHPSDKIKQLA
ncbi:oxidoreductase [Mucilaginibacter gynuensis]|uniref:Oxidoreductase n=1 Tax=Mucilaginibacter gynuensis TaxID=1302236 RepID=A0ABP8HDP1_9SPHI